MDCRAIYLFGHRRAAHRRGAAIAELARITTRPATLCDLTGGAAVHQPLGGGGVLVWVALAIVQSCECAVWLSGSTSLVDVTVTEWPALIEDSCTAVSVIVCVWLPSFDDV